MAWDQEKFLKSAHELASRFKTAQAFNDRIGVRDALYRWGKGDRPALEVILRVADEFDVSVDWLLYNDKRQAQEKIAVDNEGAMGVSSTAYKIKNTAVHNDIEYILNSDDSNAINALIFEIKGVLKVLGEKTESIQLLRQIASGQEEVVDLMRELSTVLAEEGVPAGADAKRGVRGKKTA